MINDLLKENYKHMHMKELNDFFILACSSGKLDRVDYLLTSKELKENVYISVDNDAALISACMSNQIEVVKYLLSSPKLKEYANARVSNDWIIKLTFEKRHYELLNVLLSNEPNDLLKIFDSICYDNNPSLISYFVFDLNLERTEEVQKILLNHPEAKAMMDKRDLNLQLDQKLQQNGQLKKNKI